MKLIQNGKITENDIQTSILQQFLLDDSENSDMAID